MSSTDVIIAGAGIIGLSVALELAQAGLRVTVLEQGEAMRQASWAAAGMLAAHDPENPPALHAFAEMSLATYPAFLNTVERLSGCRVPLRTARTLQGSRAVRTQPRVLSADELAALAPGLSPGDYSFSVLEEHSLDPRDLCLALPLAARAAGVTLQQGAAVLGVDRHGHSLVIRTAAGAFNASRYVHCCGAWSAALACQEAMPPVEPRKGQMLAVTMPAGAPKLACVVRTPELYLVPRGDGRMIVGATVERAGFDRAVSQTATDALLSSAAELWPPIRQGVVTERWSGLRPGTPDGLPILGVLAPGFFVATGHFRNGILLAPGTGLLLRQVMLGQAPAIPTEAFACSRFAAAAC